MTSISAILNQLEGCLKGFFKHSTAKVNKTFVIDIMEVLLLYLIMPQRIDFTQMGRFGQRHEQTYRNLFSRKFDWLRLNCYLAICYFSESRGKKAIAIDPSYISKSGKHTHGVDYRDAKQFTGLCHCQARSREKLKFAFNASLTAVNLAKIICKNNGWKYSIAKVKLLMFSAYQMNRFICRSGFRPNKHLNAKFVKELFEQVDIAA